MKSALMVLCLFAILAEPAFAGKDEVEQAVMEVMFNFDQIQSEHYIYTVRSDGWVKLTLDDAVTGDLLTNVLNALNAHPDIKGVLLRSADICATPI